MWYICCLSVFSSQPKHDIRTRVQTQATHATFNSQVGDKNIWKLQTISGKKSLMALPALTVATFIFPIQSGKHNYIQIQDSGCLFLYCCEMDSFQLVGAVTPRARDNDKCNVWGHSFHCPAPALLGTFDSWYQILSEKRPGPIAQHGPRHYMTQYKHSQYTRSHTYLLTTVIQLSIFIFFPLLIT